MKLSTKQTNKLDLMVPEHALRIWIQDQKKAYRNEKDRSEDGEYHHYLNGGLDLINELEGLLDYAKAQFKTEA